MAVTLSDHDRLPFAEEEHVAAESQSNAVLPGEEWRAAPGFEGAYEVSSTGRVRSLARFRRGRGGRPTRVTARLLKPTLANGYPSLTLGGRCVRVHRLVAGAFLPNPDLCPEVNHKDGNKANNAVENLEWVTHRGNGAHASLTGLLAVGERHGRSKLTSEVVARIRGSDRRSAGRIAADLNVDPETVRLARMGVTWAHVVQGEE